MYLCAAACRVLGCLLAVLLHGFNEVLNDNVDRLGLRPAHARVRPSMCDWGPAREGSSAHRSFFGWSRTRTVTVPFSISWAPTHRK